MLRRPAYVVRAPASEPGVRSLPERGLLFFCLTLTLLVAQVFADDHNSAITTNHLALVADGLDARLNLHGSFLLVAVDDAAEGQVVRAELHHYAVLRKDPDVVLTHLSRDVSKDEVTVCQFHTERRIRQRLNHSALNLDDTVLLGHDSTNVVGWECGRAKTPDRSLYGTFVRDSTLW